MPGATGMGRVWGDSQAYASLLARNNLKFTVEGVTLECPVCHVSVFNSVDTLRNSLAWQEGSVTCSWWPLTFLSPTPLPAMLCASKGLHKAVFLSAAAATCLSMCRMALFIGYRGEHSENVISQGCWWKTIHPIKSTLLNPSLMFKTIQFNCICIALNHHYCLKGLNRPNIYDTVYMTVKYMTLSYIYDESWTFEIMLKGSWFIDHCRPLCRSSYEGI